MSLLTLEEAEELSGIPSAELLDLVNSGVLRAEMRGGTPFIDRDQFEQWRRPPLPKRWAERLHVKADERYAGLDRAALAVRRALERFLRDVHTAGDPLMPIPSAPDRLRFVRYSASSPNDLNVLRSWLREGPDERNLPQAGWEEDEWE